MDEQSTREDPPTDAHICSPTIRPLVNATLLIRSHSACTHGTCNAKQCGARDARVLLLAGGTGHSRGDAPRHHAIVRRAVTRACMPTAQTAQVNTVQ